jgi:hypothetical protein
LKTKLDLIAEGKAEYLKSSENISTPHFLKDVKSKDKMDKITNMGEADPIHTCPICGGNP